MSPSTLERQLPLFPLQQAVLFPGMLLPLHIFEERYKLMIASCQVTDQLFGVVLIRHGKEVGETAEPVDMGCTARIIDLQRLPGGRLNVMAIGEHRFRIANPPQETNEGFLTARVVVTTDESIPPHIPDDLPAAVLNDFDAYLSTLARVNNSQSDVDLSNFKNDPTLLSFQIGASLRVNHHERQALLETDDLVERLQQERRLLRRELQTLRLMLGARGAEKNIGPFSLN